MNLKESFRYHNYLDSLIERTSMYLRLRGNMTKVQETHLRKKTNPDAEDETIDATPERPLKADNNKIIEFLTVIADEKIRLAIAVEEAKMKYRVISYDAALVANKCRQSVAQTLRSIAAIKSQESITSGRAYKFNADGNQMPYIYDVKSVTTIDFDRETVKRLAKKYADEADRVSDLLDHAMLDVAVDFEPKFDMTESFEDTVETYCAQ